MMKKVEGRRITAIDAFHLVEKSVQELKAKLAEAERDKKSADVALEGAEWQTESQWKQLR